jgi:hypothetical protein
LPGNRTIASSALPTQFLTGSSQNRPTSPSQLSGEVNSPWRLVRQRSNSSGISLIPVSSTGWLLI